MTQRANQIDEEECIVTLAQSITIISTTGSLKNLFAWLSLPSSFSRIANIVSEGV